VHSNSGEAFTSNNRMKPDVVAPGSTLSLANDDWESQADWDSNLSGCSFATPIVAGLMAQQIEAGNRLGFSTDPLVIKSTIMNSAEKVLNKQGLAWEPTSVIESAGVYSAEHPLDTHSGAGQVNGEVLSMQYLAGEQGPGLVNPIGWDLNTISNLQTYDYTIDPSLIFGSKLSATLSWYRMVDRIDNGNGIVDAGDIFTAPIPLSDMNLQILKNGILVAESISAADNVEHLFIDIDRSAQYTLRVVGTGVFGPVDTPQRFGLAWFGTAVPEPNSFAMLVIAFGAIATNRRVACSRAA
jgi:hypothetical protein